MMAERVVVLDGDTNVELEETGRLQPTQPCGVGLTSGRIQHSPQFRLAAEIRRCIPGAVQGLWTIWWR
ncbi:hypothetical protein E2C01_083778 [Portunus trituberculatus]|uniref:Uncharacterized protein n=1 Tax=Portunus trituberculatus TaxID=210409 RepID=A0A5B7J268_PORTR|nr:hypothetical protein [Portunus trituberculatus]